MAASYRLKKGEWLGLTRRGKGSKLVVENYGLPIDGLAAAAQRAEVKLAEPALATVKVPRLWGRLRIRPKELVVDKGYDSRPLLQHRLRSRGVKPCIPERQASDLAQVGNYQIGTVQINNSHFPFRLKELCTNSQIFLSNKLLRGQYGRI